MAISENSSSRGLLKVALVSCIALFIFIIFDIFVTRAEMHTQLVAVKNALTVSESSGLAAETPEGLQSLPAESPLTSTRFTTIRQGLDSNSIVSDTIRTKLAAVSATLDAQTAQLSSVIDV